MNEPGVITREQLEAAVLAAVDRKGEDGGTSAEVAHLVPGMLAAAGLPARALSRDQVKSYLRGLEDDGQVARKTGQATVRYFRVKAQEAPRAE